jgi:hypothetical protein
MSKYMVSVIAIGGEVLAVGLNGKKRYRCILIVKRFILYGFN